MNYEGVCRTAPASPGLITSSCQNKASSKLRNEYDPQETCMQLEGHPAGTKTSTGV
jgi:hypothetical protein